MDLTKRRIWLIEFIPFLKFMGLEENGYWELEKEPGVYLEDGREAKTGRGRLEATTTLAEERATPYNRTH